MANKQQLAHQMQLQGASAASIQNVLNASRPARAYGNWQTAFTAQKQQADANYQAYLARQNMAAQQTALMKQIAKPPPKANRALRSSNYQPKFKASGSKTESKRAVSKGSYQFSNPLGMGGMGSRTGGLGGIAIG
tara:strand:- start:1254 stop:1658 length:405 start_codon:yes stop_codon:yes gene_type:complete